MLRHLFSTVSLLTISILTAHSDELPTVKLDPSAHIGVWVQDLKTGEVLASTNPDEAFSPASTMKTVTAATVMRTIGPDFRFETPVILNGEIENGLFRGVMTVVASGDPTIQSQYFPEACGMTDSIVSALAVRGISRFDGCIKVEQSRFTSVGPRGRWNINDVPWDYGAPFYGFNYSDNVVKVNPIQLTAPEGSGLVLKRGYPEGPVEYKRGAYCDTLIVDGRNREAALITPMTTPDNYFITRLIKAMDRNGIKTSIAKDKKQLPTGESDTIYTHLSPAAIDICRSLLHRSDNMMADAMLRATSPIKTMSATLEAQEKMWKSTGVDFGPHRILDGSGLIRVDLLTPRGLGNMLRFMSDDPNFYSILPVCGQNGTVKNVLKNTRLSGKLALKSGSMTSVRCYAGYKIDDDGKPTHVVVVMTNNSFKSTKEIIQGIEQFLLSVF